MESRVAVVIEDQADLRELTELVLVQSGFTVVTAEDGPTGIAAVREHDPILTTLDVNMPGMDGFAVAKQLRLFSETYLVMITARADEIDIVTGFEAGADDYIVKPFSPRELRARADSMLRRPRRFGNAPEAPAAAPAPPPQEESWATAAARQLRENPIGPGPVAPAAPSPAPAAPAAAQPYAPAPAPAPPVTPAAAPGAPPAPQPAAPAPAPAPAPAAAAPAYAAPAPAPAPAPAYATAHMAAPAVALDSRPVTSINGLSMDLESGVAMLGGRRVDLSDAERELLATLMSTGRRVRSKADLVLALRGQPYVTSYFVKEIDKKNVDNHVASLRSKLGDDAEHPKYIETVRGVGYRMAVPA